MIIETDKLTKQYKTGIALNKLSLQVPRNATFGFLGPNGAGKSTAMKLLLGLIRPSSGSGAIFGHDIVQESVQIRERVGYLAQEPRFYSHMTARETLRFVARFFEMDARTSEKRIIESLELVGLANKADRAIKGFSGGERQRLGIAQAQLNDPDLLILDEPAAALDPMGRRDVLRIIKRLQERATIFYSTHILDDVQRVSDRVAILNNGTLVAQAPVAELLGSQGNHAYTVTFAGEANGAQAALQNQAWVREVAVTAKNGLTEWQVDVDDAQAAETQLLPILLHGGGDSASPIAVKSFGKRKQNLENVFVNLVEGE
ncbi:MAG: ABC transporter ATP-binding protein [Chloroflexi bacterium]|nr:ABC transporter ATP-binding protein [Chloroflexota bacterium]